MPPSLHMHKAPIAQPDQARTQVAIYGTPLRSVAPKLFEVLFPSLGLHRFKYIQRETSQVEDASSPWRHDIDQAHCLGTVVTMPLKIAVMPHMDVLIQEARTIGSVNTTFFTEDGTHVGTNTDQIGVANALLTAILKTSSPFPADTPKRFAPGTAAGLMVGGGGAARAAVFAMLEMGCGTVLLVNRDEQEIRSLIENYAGYHIQPVRSLEEADLVLAALKADGKALAVGVGAIPPVEPRTEAEHNVYKVAEYLFTLTGKPSFATADAGFLPIPEQPIFLEMPYTPRVTRMRGLADQGGWKTVCGIEVVLEGCFEQIQLWTSRSVSLEAREAGRQLLRRL